MAINVGGFFASLSLKSDKASFDESKKDLKGIEDQTKKTGIEFDSFVKNSIKGLVALGAAALGSSYAVSNIQAKMQLTAAKAGMSYNEFNKFSGALRLLGVDSDHVAAKMASVNSALNDFKAGKNSEAYGALVKNLALLGITDINAFAKMSQTERVSLVAKKAESYRGTDLEVGKRNIAEDIFGLEQALLAEKQEGSKYPTFSIALSVGSESTWGSNAANVTKNSQAFNDLSLQMDQLWKTAGESFGNSFRPIVEDLAKFIKNHKAEIKQFFEDVSTLLKNLAEALGPTIRMLGSVMGNLAAEGANYSTVAEFKGSNPEVAKRIEANLRKAGYKTHNVAENLLSQKAANETAAFAQVEAIAIKLLSGSYSGATTREERERFGNPNATNVVFNGFTLTGVDFNRVINYSAENPYIDPRIIAQAAIIIASMAGTQ